MKRILSVFLVLILLVSLTPTQCAFAAVDPPYTGTCGDNLRWALYNSGELRIWGTGSMNSFKNYCSSPWHYQSSLIKKITILPGVTSIGNYAFYTCSRATGITIPDSVTHIGDYSFAYSGIESIKLSDNLKYIGGKAFYGCDLQEILISSNVESFDFEAFAECIDLMSINVAQDNAILSSQDGVLFNKNKTRLICYPRGRTDSYIIPSTVTTIGTGAFYGANITQVFIPDSVVSIESEAFRLCRNLEDINMPDSIVQIGVRAFDNCDSLFSIGLPNKLEVLSEYLFCSCDNLSSIRIPKSINEIGTYTFDYCTYLTDIYYTGTETEWNEFLGNKTWTQTIHYNYNEEWPVPKPWEIDESGILIINATGPMRDFNSPYVSMQNLPWYKERNNIKKVIINEGVTSIGTHAFHECINLEEAKIPDTITKINLCAFSHCSNMTSISFSANVRSIDDNAFYNCSNLSDVYFDGTEIEWSKIQIGENNEWLLNATVHYLKEHTITYDYTTNGGNSVSKATDIVAEGDNVDLSVNATKTGWEFVGWNTNPNATTALSSYTVTGDVTLYAIYKKTLTGIFYYGDNAIQTTKTTTIYNNATSGNITLPNLASYPGWNVVGWRNDTSALSKEYDDLESITISSNTKFYGIYSRTLTLSYDANGGDAVPSSQTATQYYNAYGNKQSVSFTLASAISKSGCTFGKWAKGSISGTGYNAGSSISISDNTTMYARWTTVSSVSTPTIAVSNITGGKSITITCSTSNATIYYTTNGNTPTTNSTKYTGAINLTSVGTTNIKAMAVRNGYNNSPVATKSITVLKTATPTASPSGGTITSSASVSLSCATSGATIYYTTNGNTPTTSSTKYTDSITINSTTTLKAIAVASGYANSSVATYTYQTTTLNTYTVTFDANGGTGTPSPQTKAENIPLTLSNHKPSKTYAIQYNATGGSVTPASKNISCTFNNWNTEKNGNGTSYTSGGVYNSNADVTLYAQWINPSAGTLAVPSRIGYDFVGWFTSAVNGVQVTELSTVTENITLYAHWVADSYNMGDETYSFTNYGDSDSLGGHCFGMSITSAGYHNEWLDIGRIGGNTNTSLYSFSKTQKVKQPICYYQGIQGNYARNATVAGGSYYLYGYYDIGFDWQDVVEYVKNHNYDNTGLLQIGFRKNNEGGHAINFLRYENVNGQDRIYAYDNNFPDTETYFYQDSSERVWQTPVGTFSGSIDCIALRDSRIYFNSVGDFDATHVLYMAKNAATVQDYNYSYMEGTFSGEDYVMYEIPASQDRVIIIPNRDYADFIYMGTEYSFGEITDETRGELRFASLEEDSGNTEAYFRIFESNVSDNINIEMVDLIPSFSSYQSHLFGSITANIKNGTESKQSATVVLGIYDVTGRMISIESKSYDFNSGNNEVTFNNIFLENAANANCKIKCFVWNSIGRMKPMSASIEKNIK